MATREQNEKKFGKWTDLPTGGRVYWLVVVGHHGWSARYLKAVDGAENTIRFWQEVYNENNELIETHEKFPVDRGHQKN
jgi:hypothetical protein